MASTGMEPDLTAIDRELADARDGHWEDPAAAWAAAARALEHARAGDLEPLRARALALQGIVTLNRGDLAGAFRLAAAADESAQRGDDRGAQLEVAAFEAQLSFFAGAYTEALRYATRAIALSDELGDTRLRVFARRAACLVLGNLEAPGWIAELDRLIDLSEELGDRWQEALSRNDRAHHLMVSGDPAGADAELDRALELLDAVDGSTRLGEAVVHCTRAELRLRTGRHADALAEAEDALRHLLSMDRPNPYVFGMTVRIEVQALLALGRPHDAQQSGARALERLGDHLPQARSMILETVATALREAGHLEEAYEALAQGAALERQVLRELTELQVGFERATQEAKAARDRVDALAAKNRELEEVLIRDPLTGLHNRRHLLARLEELRADPPAAPFSVAVFDLDRFKAINDAYGHRGGDQVLARVGVMLAAVVRATDTVARSGGEEFVLLMPDTDAGAAHTVCERLLGMLRDEQWLRLGTDLRVTASAGIATATPGEAVDGDALLEQADRRLYEAKRAGRDRVV